jgi:Domain of unknown function (DUF5625)
MRRAGALLCLLAIAWGMSASAQLGPQTNHRAADLAKLPLILPFAVHKADETVSAEVIISNDRVYPFAMSFGFKEHDAADRARVRNLVGEYEQDKDGHLRKPGLEIPLRLQVNLLGAAGKTALVDQTVMVGRMYAQGFDVFRREVGFIRLTPGRYEIRTQSLFDHPELEHTVITFEMHGWTRGDIFTFGKQSPSTPMKALVGQIHRTDLLNRLSDLERLADDLGFARNKQPHLEFFSIPMPVATWQGCSYFIVIDTDLPDSFWISKNCGGENRHVYKGSRAKLFYQ